MKQISFPNDNYNNYLILKNIIGMQSQNYNNGKMTISEILIARSPKLSSDEHV